MNLFGRTKKKYEYKLKVDDRIVTVYISEKIHKRLELLRLKYPNNPDIEQTINDIVKNCWEEEMQ